MANRRDLLKLMPVALFASGGGKLPNGVRDAKDAKLTREPFGDLRVYYEGPTDQVKSMTAGSLLLKPGMSPHPPHQHEEEEFMVITEGTAEIVVEGKKTQVGPGSMMYCAGNHVHGIVNNGKVPLLFYYYKWESLMQRVYVITTGGTIEKVYSEQTGNVENLDTKIQRYFRLLRLPDTEVVTIHLMNIDSLDMTDEDRMKVLEQVRKTFDQPAPIVITHGTDTMVDTGMLLKRSLPDLPVPIIFTGAMTPLGFEGSDGLQNLTESLLAARLLAPGVWLVMHNQVFPIDRVKKDRQLARFVWK